MVYIRYTLFFSFLLYLGAASASAQDSTSVEASAILSSGGETPFWLHSNRYGIYSPSGSQFAARLQYHSAGRELGFLSIRYGADVIARPGAGSTLSFNQGYLKIGVYALELAAGRFHNSSPVHDRLLSMGSMGISTNATPIPQVRLGFAGWTPVPFTNEFIKIRAHLAHGWLGSRRYTDNVLLHEKVGHLRFGGNLPVNLYGGLAHYVKWGGKNHPEQGDIPSRLSDWWNVFFAFAGDNTTPGPDQAYVLGDHLGAWDFGMFLRPGEADIKLYRQFPLETKDNIKLKSPQDALTGISVRFPPAMNFPLERFLYEFLYTKYQDGPRRPNIVNGHNCVENPAPDFCSRDIYRGNENYYNHEIYKTGWAYNYRTIGNPLFILNEDNLGILNNRVVAHHIGMIASVGDVRFSTKATYSRNYGKRCDNRIPDLGEGALFGIECDNVVDTVGGRSVVQWSFLSGAEIPLRLFDERDVSLILELAFDNGALVGDQVGGIIGLRWQPE